MKRIVIFLAVTILAFNLYGQKNDTAYIYTFGGIQDDGCQQIEQTPDGGYIMIGTTASFGLGYSSFYAVKTDSSFKFQWSKCYGGAQIQQGYSVINTLDSGYAFAGFTNSYGAGGYDVFLVKADSKGNEQWQQTYGGSNWDFGYSVKQLKDSGYIISGLTYSYGIGNGNMYIIRTDKMGNTLWQQTAGGTGYSTGNSIYLINDSVFAIAGGTTSYGINDTNACIVKIKDCGDSGHVLSTWIFNANKNSIFYSMRPTSDKGYVMYGSTDSIPDSSYACKYTDEYCPKIDSDGNIKWCQLIHFPSTSYGKDAVQLSDNSILSLGATNAGGAGGFDFHIQRFDQNGNYLQAVTAGGEKDELPGSIVVGKNGDLIFAGCSDSPNYTVGLFDIFVVRFKSTDTLPNGTGTTKVVKYQDTSQFPASVRQIANKTGVNIYPNPVVTCATILIQGDGISRYTFNLFNINGQCVLTDYPLQSIGHGQSVAQLQRGNLSTGVYSYQVISNGNANVAEGKLIIE